MRLGIKSYDTDRMTHKAGYQGSQPNRQARLQELKMSSDSLYNRKNIYLLCYHVLT